MLGKASLLISLLAILGMVTVSEKPSQAQTSYVNAHVTTKPSKTETDYYWIRTLVDPTWGISGFLYVDTGENNYYVLPTSVNFVSATDVIMSSPVTVGVDRHPGYLQVELKTVGGLNYAGFVVTSLLDPSMVLDFSPGIKTYGSGYIRFKAY